MRKNENLISFYLLDMNEFKQQEENKTLILNQKTTDLCYNKTFDIFKKNATLAMNVLLALPPDTSTR